MTDYLLKRTTFSIEFVEIFVEKEQQQQQTESLKFEMAKKKFFSNSLKIDMDLIWMWHVSKLQSVAICYKSSNMIIVDSIMRF